MQRRTLNAFTKYTTSICAEEELYFHRNGDWIDFNGYFNLFYIEKRKKYTNQENLCLHLNVKKCSAIHLVHDSQILQEIKLTSNTPVLFEFPYENTDKGVFLVLYKDKHN